MKVLLLNPTTISNRKVIRTCRNQVMALEGLGIWPPIDLAEIAGVLRQGGFDQLRILDSVIAGHSFNRMIAQVISFNPDLMIVHNITPTIYDDKKMAKMVKNKLPNIKIAFYGLHATARPEDILGEEIEFAIRSEPEYTSLELAKCLMGQNINELRFIKGLSFFSDGRQYNNPDRALADDLDAMPKPARDLLDNNRYTLLSKRAPFATIRFSRGCPYSCIYCSSSLYSKKSWRCRSPRSIVAEIKNVKETLKINNFMFLSDTFTLDEGIILELCELMKKETPGVSWVCNSRTDTLTQRMAYAMKEAGCWLVSLGIESGDEKILRNIKKGATIEDAARCVRLLRKTGIKSIGYYMFGLPGETRQTIDRTIFFAKELDTDYAYFFTATPFPGTEYFELAKRQGWLISQDWRRYYQGRSDVLSFDNLDRNEIFRAIQKAYRAFYLRPARIIRECREIKNAKDIFRYARIGCRLLTNNF